MFTGSSPVLTPKQCQFEVKVSRFKTGNDFFITHPKSSLDRFITARGNNKSGQVRFLRMRQFLKLKQKMGARGSCKSKVRIEFSVKQKKSNSDEHVKDFLKTNNVFVKKNINEVSERIISDLYSKDTIFILYNKHGEEYDSRFLTKKELIDGFIDYRKSLNLKILEPLGLLELKNINLNLIKTHNITEISQEFTGSINLLDINEDVYNPKVFSKKMRVKKISELLLMDDTMICLETDVDVY